MGDTTKDLDTPSIAALSACVAEGRAAKRAKEAEAVAEKQARAAARAVYLANLLPNLAKALRDSSNGNPAPLAVADALYTDKNGFTRIPAQVAELIEEAMILGLCDKFETHATCTNSVPAGTPTPWYGVHIRLEPGRWYTDKPPPEMFWHITPKGGSS